MTKVFALGGSVFTENLDKLEEYVEAFEGFDEQIAIVTGAGSLKTHINAVDAANQGEQDLIGIKATRLNAQTLKTAMDCHPKVPEKPEEIQEIASTGKDFVMGGMVPGYSTDAVAATVAELLDGELIIATSVDGVYTADPEREDAEKLDEVSIDELRQIISGNNEAGGHELVDFVALEIIERSKIETTVMEGLPQNVESLETIESTRIKSL
ncbi:MAG: UMP kinase [Nanohaloarchaea archaeon]|nr:UMP kinase [Candidatus Nanohaloarchaea archaeon]